MGAPGTPDALTPDDGTVLAGLAVAAVAARLAGHPLDGASPLSTALQADGASFVTLRTSGELRGCIGTLKPVRPLYRDVTRNAVRAMTDPRLPPVTAGDWPRLDVSVSVLSPAEALPCADRAGLLAALRPGIDGLILSQGSRRATFLPTVWTRLSSPERFVNALLAKGGWPAGAWPSGLSASRYTTTEFHDRSPRPISLSS
jgi:AmmeMemoRadiSam system protein A